MERENRAELSSHREILDIHYPIMAVDPYALGFDLSDPENARVRLSYYSHQITHFAKRLYKLGNIDRIIVFADASFGANFPSTGELMKKHFVEVDGIPEEKVTVFDEADQNQTSTQLKRLSEFLEEEDLVGTPVLYPVWKYHEERVRNHSRGYGVNVVTAPIEDFYQYTGIAYDFQRMVDRLPLDEAERMEKGRRIISRIDKKGFIPRIAKPVLGGAHMLDNVRTPDGGLEFEYKPGKLKLKELGLVK